MINISLETHPNLYYDYRAGLQFLKEINEDDYEYPEHTNFHVFTEVKTEKELECIKSYLATQNLDKTKLIVWSDYDISKNKLIQPFKNLVDWRIFRLEEEVQDTQISHVTSQKVLDHKYYMRSGILRFLVTHKYGGIWADMDMVFLRDFKPILDCEWAYMWGSETDFYNFGPCAAMMSIHRDSEHSNVCMEEISKTILVPDSTVLDHELLAKVYTRRPFIVYPSTFFNTEWLISKVDEPLSRLTESNWFYNKNKIAKYYLFLEAFSWHWHNSSKKSYSIEYGSKFDLLRKRTDKLLKERGIL